MMKWIPLLAVSVVLLLLAPEAAWAQDAAANSENWKGLVAIGAGIAMGFAVLGAGLGQGMAIRGAVEGIARNPAASGKITVPMFAGLAFPESLVIFALVIGYLLQSKI